MQVTVQAQGIDVMRRALLRMGDRAVDVEPVLVGPILDSLLESNARRFDSAGDGEWPDASDAWLARKAALGLDPRTEHATLELRRSLTERGGNNAYRADGGTLQVWSTSEHAQWAAKRGNQLVKPTEVEKRAWVRAVQVHIVSNDRMPSAGLLAGIV